MVQEIHQVLMDREDTCHRTCFSLQLDGNVLDNFAELKSIEGLQEGSLLKVVEGQILGLKNQHKTNQMLHLAFFLMIVCSSSQSPTPSVRLASTCVTSETS